MQPYSFSRGKPNPPKVSKSQNKTFALFKTKQMPKTPQYSNKIKKEEIYFQKANDLYDLGDSCPSMYCASIVDSEVGTFPSNPPPVQLQKMPVQPVIQQQPQPQIPVTPPSAPVVTQQPAQSDPEEKIQFCKRRNASRISCYEIPRKQTTEFERIYRHLERIEPCFHEQYCDQVFSLKKD